MRAAGRESWSEDDYSAAVRVTDRLWVVYDREWIEPQRRGET